MQSGELNRSLAAECLVARRSLSRNCRDSPERDEPNTREGVRKTATLSLPEATVFPRELLSW